MGGSACNWHVCRAECVPVSIHTYMYVLYVCIPVTVYSICSAYPSTGSVVICIV